VAVFESLGFRAGENGRLDALLDLHQQGLAAYRSRHWARAERLFERALEVAPEDCPARLYRDRARAYAAAPPLESWDGVWSMTEK
jgi:adenylate cyclase